MQRPVLSVKRNFSWKLFFILWIGAVVSTIAVIPYALTIQQPALEQVTLPLPLYQIIIIQILANSLFFALLIGGGYYFATRIGLGLPLLEGWIHHESVQDKFKQIIPIATGIGIFSAVLILILDGYVFNPLLESAGIRFPENIEPAVWKGFLASFYGGITEELLMRLFFLTFFAWLGAFIWHRKDGRPILTVLWIANILAALIFGLGHLPATAAMGLPLNVLVISRGLVLNGIAGLAFGWLYWSFGLESAMIAHFCADIVLHVLMAAL